MKRLLLVVALVSCIAPVSFAQEKWRNKAGDIVVGNEIEASRRVGVASPVSGSFTLVRDDVSGIESNKRGGACLIVDIVPQACKQDSDCATPTLTGPQYEGKYSYCVENKCWVRPGKQPKYCRVGVALEEGKVNDLPVVAADVTGNGAQHRWRVLTCLNPLSAPKACGDVNITTEVHDSGTPEKVKP